MRKHLSLIAALAMLLAGMARAEASFHVWVISEVYSDRTGNVQYVELFCQQGADGENLLTSHTLVASQGSQQHVFTFPGDIDFATSNKHLLLATTGYASLPGAVAPDFIIPSGFLFFNEGTLNYAESTQILPYSGLPFDGYNSLNFPGGTIAPNSPTNFAGATSTIPNTPVADPLPSIPKGAITVELESVSRTIPNPLGLLQPDDGSDRFFIYSEDGTVTAFVSGVEQTTKTLDVSSQIIFDGERGLIGMALHPDFANHPKLYAFTSEPTSGTADFTNVDNAVISQSVIAEYTMSGGDPNSNIVDPASRRVIMRIDKAQGNHNGGTLRFGPDGNLYIAVGDGGGGGDAGQGHVAGGNSQSLDYIYGKLLRINVDITTGTVSANGEYSVPLDNPFVGTDGLDEIFAYGFRNPFSFSFDTSYTTPNNYRLYVGDVGQNKIEEIDLLTSASLGGNFGWVVKEGSFFYADGGVTLAPSGSVPPNLIDPIAEYDHDDGVAVIGGAVYHGAGIPELAGRYVFGDLADPAPNNTGRLFYLDENNFIKELRVGLDDRFPGFSLQGVSQDQAGEIYVMGLENGVGVVYKLVRVVFSGAAAGDSWSLYR